MVSRAGKHVSAVNHQVEGRVEQPKTGSPPVSRRTTGLAFPFLALLLTLSASLTAAALFRVRTAGADVTQDAPDQSVAPAESAAQPEPTPARPVLDLVVRDKPLDAGGTLRITFGRAPGDSLGLTGVARYELWRQAPGVDSFAVARTFTARQRLDRFTYDDSRLWTGQPYVYRVRTVAADGSTAEGAASPPAVPTRQWFYTNKLNTLVAVIAFVAFILGFVHAARRGRELKIRRIAGLDAIDEAVGRCTEMGRPTLYIPGISTISDVATIASLNILSEVAKKIARYQARILVPNRDPIVYPVTQDVVKEAFVTAGYPHNYRPEDIYFVTNDQFTYAAAVCGTMVREKPGANLLLGMFYAESLVLAETGASIGAIQIAGTDAITQLPFFVTACDYTIIGEELYAASAYIGRDPTLLGSLKGQDVYKMICIVMILLGVALMTAGVLTRGEPFTWIGDLLRVRGTGG